MTIREWLNNDGRFCNNRGFSFEHNPETPGEVKMIFDDPDPLSPSKQTSIQLEQLNRESPKTLNTVLRELERCEEFKSSTLTLCSSAESVVVDGKNILSFNPKVKLCFIGDSLFNKETFVIRCTEDSVVLKPNIKHKKSKNPLDLLEDLRKQTDPNDISHLFKNGDDYLT